VDPLNPRPRRRIGASQFHIGPSRGSLGMSSALGQSVWFSNQTSVFFDVVALLCKQRAAATLTFADGSDHSATLYEVEGSDLWYRPCTKSGSDSIDRYEGVPIEHVMAIRVL
jgi:hypothetical protein